jgi:hypothetical protein
MPTMRFTIILRQGDLIKKKRCPEEQIINATKDYEAVFKVDDIRRRFGISVGTF